MVGTGLTFAVGVGAVMSILGALAWLQRGASVVDIARTVGKFSVVAFIVGVAFSGVLAIAARGRSFNQLSLRLVTSLGAGTGFLYWLFLAMTGGRVWAPRVALLNFGVLIVLGAGSAAARFTIARRGRAPVRRR
jgi:hypothetical protein